MKIDDRYVVSIPQGLCHSFYPLSDDSFETLEYRTYSFVQIEPEYVIAFSVVYVPCEQSFTALTLPKLECPSAASSLKSFSIMSMCLIFAVLMNGLGFLSV